MTKIILIMYLCSSVPGNKCGIIPTPNISVNIRKLFNEQIKIT